MKPLKLAHRIREAVAIDPPNRLDSAAFLFLLVFVGSLPWTYHASGHPPFPGTPSAGNLFLELGAFLISAAAFRARTPTAAVRLLATAVAALGGITLLGVVQLLPLPVAVLDIVAPVNTKIYHETGQLLELFGKRAPLARVSLAPTETARTLLLLLAYAALFASTARLLRTRFRRRFAAGSVVVSALAQVSSFPLKAAPEDRIQGAFTNPDHFAGYLEIALALAFGWLWTSVLTRTDRAASSEPLTDRIEKRLLPTAASALLWSVIFLGILLTRSRGGILAAGVTTLALFAMGLLHRRVAFRRRAVLSTALFLLAGGVLAATLAGVTPFRRFLKADLRHPSENTRVVIWRTSLLAWQEFPILGSGLGAFHEAFRRVQPRDLPLRIDHAHSDFLEILVTGGAVGAALGVLLFGSLFVLIYRRWRDERHREESALVLAGFGALLSLTLHGLVEFSLSNPPIPATLACVLGAAWATGNSR